MGADLLFTVSVADVLLDGVVDLNVLGDTLGFVGDVALTGLLDVEMTLDLNLAFGVDSTGFFIRTSGPLLPELKITDLSVSGEVIGSGNFGFLGVDVKDATLTLGPGVELVFKLTDPGTGGSADNLIRAPSCCRLPIRRI